MDEASSHHILVVDDEVHITHVVSLKLRNAGFEVTTAGDGEEALEVAKDLLPDLLITDLQMPYMSGLELCKALAQHEEAASIPALMLTARGYSLGAEDIAGTNIKAVMSKPFSPKEVLRRVNEILGLADADGLDSSGPQSESRAA